MIKTTERAYLGEPLYRAVPVARLVRQVQAQELIEARVVPPVPRQVHIKAQHLLAPLRELLDVELAQVGFAVALRVVVVAALLNRNLDERALAVAEHCEALDLALREHLKKARVGDAPRPDWRQRILCTRSPPIVSVCWHWHQRARSVRNSQLSLLLEYVYRQVAAHSHGNCTYTCKGNTRAVAHSLGLSHWVPCCLNTAPCLRNSRDYVLSVKEESQKNRRQWKRTKKGPVLQLLDSKLRLSERRVIALDLSSQQLPELFLVRPCKCWQGDRSCRKLELQGTPEAERTI